MGTGLSIIPFDARHGPGVVRVISSVFREYGVTFEPSGYDADLTDIPRRYLEAGGCFAVLEDAGQVVGTTAAVPHHGATCEIKRLYLLPEYRGRGHGRALLEHALGWAEAAGYLVALAWSDTRFTTAHRVYERLGFARFGERTVDDVDRSREYGYRRRLRPRVLAAAGDPIGGCVLCRMITGEVKADRILATRDVVGILNDVEPLSRGHCVFFPRRHVAALHEMDDGDLGEVMAAVKRVARALDLQHYNVLQNNGALAGQTVFHVHVHLIPKGSPTDGLVRERGDPGYIDQREISRRLRELLP